MKEILWPILITISTKKFTLISLLAVTIILTLLICTAQLSYQVKHVEAISSQTINSTFVSEKIQEGNLLINKSKYDDAIKLYDQVLKIDPTSVEALNGKGLAFNKLGKYEEALTWFDKALKIDPNFVNALYNKGGALAELGKYDEAAKWTNKALEIDKTNQNASNSKSSLLPND